MCGVIAPVTIPVGLNSIALSTCACVCAWYHVDLRVCVDTFSFLFLFNTHSLLPSACPYTNPPSALCYSKPDDVSSLNKFCPSRLKTSQCENLFIFAFSAYFQRIERLSLIYLPTWRANWRHFRRSITNFKVCLPFDGFSIIVILSALRVQRHAHRGFWKWEIDLGSLPSVSEASGSLPSVSEASHLDLGQNPFRDRELDRHIPR